ncbi:MAG TPA: hypothetical protein VFJ58_22235 [Armatimonadota bacterium]|nr:hypothetical protein [Armatimonadota bacterium]
MYQTPFLSLDDLERAVQLLSEVGVHDVRYELAWGKPDALDFAQAKPHPVFAMVDRLSAALKKNDITPMLVMGYCPNPLKSRAVWEAWKDLPNNLDEWQAITRAYAEHLRDNDGVSAPFYEVWNEPDLSLGNPPVKVFFMGGPADYGSLYHHAAAGIKRGDSDSLVGGPAIAWQTEYFKALLDSGAPVDFASIHSYANFPVQLGLMRQTIHSSPNEDLHDTLPIFLTEYASYESFTADGPNSRYPAAARFFRDVNGLLQETDTPKVYWAQWVDDDLGFLTFHFKKKALFNALRIYATMLPVDRCPVIPDGVGGVGVMAAADDHQAGVALWNENDHDSDVAVELHHIPFAAGTLELYRIDRSHASYLDNPNSEELVELSAEPVVGYAASWTGSLPAQSVLFLRCIDGSGASLLRPSRIGTYVRSLYAFPDRTGDSYADFDPRTSIARLGIGSRDRGQAQIGVVIDNPVKPILAQVRQEGPFRQLDANSVFGIRIDYANNRGHYSRSVMLYGGAIYSPHRTGKFYWGAGGPAAAHSRSIPEMMNGRLFDIDVHGLAPNDWNRRRVILTFMMQGVGAGSRARFSLIPAR